MRGIGWAMGVAMIVGCSGPRADAPAAGQPAGREATFVNRVWRVAESGEVEPGQLYVFLSDGTLVIASPHGTPSLGRWSGGGRSLTMIEEGIPYRTDIVASSGNELRLRSHNPAGVVEMRLVPAEETTGVDTGSASR